MTTIIGRVLAETRVPYVFSVRMMISALHYCYSTVRDTRTPPTSSPSPHRHVRDETCTCYDDAAACQSVSQSPAALCQLFVTPTNPEQPLICATQPSQRPKLTHVTTVRTTLYFTSFYTCVSKERLSRLRAHGSYRFGKSSYPKPNKPPTDLHVTCILRPVWPRHRSLTQQ